MRKSKTFDFRLNHCTILHCYHLIFCIISIAFNCYESIRLKKLVRERLKFQHFNVPLKRSAILCRESVCNSAAQGLDTQWVAGPNIAALLATVTSDVILVIPPRQGPEQCFDICKD